MSRNTNCLKDVLKKNQRIKSEKYLKEFPVAFETEKKTQNKNLLNETQETYAPEIPD